jgi:hypothetical protein
VGEDGSTTYFLTDTHFNYESSVAWIEALIRRLDRNAWEGDAVKDLGIVEFSGNLATVAGIRKSERVRQVSIDRGRSPRPDLRLHDPFSEDQSATEIFRMGDSIGSPMIEDEVLILKDSFMDIPMGSLIQYLGNVTFTDWRSSDSIAYFLDRLREADIVILETGEEHLATRLITGDAISVDDIVSTQGGIGS